MQRRKPMRLQDYPHGSIRKSITKSAAKLEACKAEREREKAGLEKALMAVTPVNLRGVIRYCHIIPALVSRGETGIQLRPESNPRYYGRFKSFASMRRRFNRLRKAWKGQVVITYEWKT